MRRARAIAALARWPNGILAIAAVVVGAGWARAAPPSLPPLLWTCAAAAGLTIVANAWNALQDRAIDARAHPGRPIPSGAARPRDAVALTVAGAVAALGCSALAAPGLAPLSAGIIALFLVYAWVKEVSGPAANALAATLASLPFLYGAWSQGAPGRAWPLIAVALPIQFAREVAKDIDDAVADAPFRRTWPIVAGVLSARRAVVAATGIALAALALFAAQWTRTAWGIVPAGCACVYGAALSARGRSGAAAWYKLGMLAALAGLLAGLARCA